MKRFDFAARIAAAAAVAVALVVGAARDARATGGATVVYAASVFGVDIFDAATHAQVGRLWLPEKSRVVDLATGVNGDVWVSWYDAAQYQATVAHYVRGQATPSYEITTLGNSSELLAVSDQGELAMTTHCPYDGCDSPGNRQAILFFEPGRRRPARTIKTDANDLPKPAFGPDGTLYVGTRTYVLPGETQIRERLLQTSATVEPNTAVDRNGDLVVMEGGGVVRVYGGKSGRLFRVIPIFGVFDLFENMAVSHDGAYLYISTASGYIMAYPYPGGGMSVTTFAPGSIFAVGTL